MKLDKKQLPQLIVLGVLVMICIGYVSFTIAKPPQGNPAAAPGQKAAANGAAGSSAGSDTSEDVSGSVPFEVFPNVTAALPRRDPFATQALSSEAAAQTSQKVTISPVRQRPVRDFRPVTNSGSVPRIDVKAINPFTQPSVQVAPLPQVHEAPPEPKFTLTGVIRGNQNVAIIQSGSGGRHVVREGQMIDGQYRVQSVSDHGVILVNKNRRIYVKLGGVKNAS
jgi:hypothetical protein